MIKITFALAVLIITSPPEAATQMRSSESSQYTDPRGEPELTVCTQNLNNYGTYKMSAARLGLDKEGFEKKEKAIAVRVKKIGCDIIAVQEVLSKSEEDGKQVLENLARVIKMASGRVFEVVIGSSNDLTLRNGFLLARDRVELMNSLSYSKVELPRISEKQRPRLFLRSPLEIQVQVKGRGESSSKTVTLINFHNKSKAGSAKDPVELEWETYRMEMSEAIRRIVEVRHRKSLIGSDNLLVVLGDRNSNYDTASAKILEGSLRLSDFMAESYCRLSKRGVPLCRPGAQTHQVLTSVITNDVQTRKGTGTYDYKGVYSWIDDILISSSDLAMAWAEFDKAGDYASGVVFDPEEASDHGMVYARLNW